MFCLNEEKRSRLYKRQLKKSCLLIDDCNFSVKYQVVTAVSRFVLNPALNIFVLWILMESIKKGKKRLYFLSRDGYLMYRAACIYCEEWNLDIDCRYVYCSRFSLRIPLYHINMDEAMGFICRGGIDVTMEKIFSRAGLTETEAAEVERRSELPYERKEVIPYVQLENVREKLEKCNFFLECVNKHSMEKYPQTEQYLRQAGLLDEVPDAIVDSGWTGSMQQTLEQLLKKMGRERSLDGFYWGLYEIPENANPAQYQGFYFQPEGCYRKKIFFSNCLFETVFSAPHGMTKEYIVMEDKCVPICDDPDKKNSILIRYEEKELLGYTKKCASKISDLRQIDFIKEKKIIFKNLALFMGRPTKMEAETYGKLLFSDDMLEDFKQPLAVILSAKELQANHFVHKMLTMLGLRQGVIRESAWYEGSAVRSSRYPEWHLICYGLYKLFLYLKKNRVWRRQHGRYRT